jgi:hypothetical protein
LHRPPQRCYPEASIAPPQAPGPTSRLGRAFSSGERSRPDPSHDPHTRCRNGPTSLIDVAAAACACRERIRTANDPARDTSQSAAGRTNPLDAQLAFKPLKSFVHWVDYDRPRGAG